MANTLTRETHRGILSKASSSCLEDPLLPALPAIRVVVYQSRMIGHFDDFDLRSMLEQARMRNHELGITGLLVFDKGLFFQWLEGPADAVEAVWGSIRNDVRHDAVELLGDQMLPVRIFASWEMRLALRCSDTDDDPAMENCIHVPDALMQRLSDDPQLHMQVWRDLADLQKSGVAPDVIPDRVRVCVSDVIPDEAGAPQLHKATVTPLWLDESTDLVETLTRHAMSDDAQALNHFVSALLRHKLSAESIYYMLIEQAARHLAETCEDLPFCDTEIVLALGRLQTLSHRLSQTFLRDADSTVRPRSVLIATPPGEPHMLRLALDSGAFRHAGWDVSCGFPTCDDELSQLLHARWFDVLDLTLSNVLNREDRLPALAATIRAARDASRNEKLKVVVGGRSISERVEFSMLVGADAGCASLVRTVQQAEYLTEMRRTPAFEAARIAIETISRRLTSAA